MNKKAVGCLFALVGIPLLLVWIWCDVLDTGPHRRLAVWRINSIVKKSQADPTNRRYAKILLAKAQGDYSFEATRAVVALGEIGDAAIPVLQEIAELMNSPDLYVNREAARALLNLGARSTPVLPQLEAKVEKADTDGAWFAAAALGEIGYPAVHCIPLLESKFGIGVQFDNNLKNAIEMLREAERKHKAGAASSSMR